MTHYPSMNLTHDKKDVLARRLEEENNQRSRENAGDDPLMSS